MCALRREARSGEKQLLVACTLNAFSILIHLRYGLTDIVSA